jgi:hypothetical protein
MKLGPQEQPRSTVMNQAIAPRWTETATDRLRASSHHVTVTGSFDARRALADKAMANVHEKFASISRKTG